MNPQPTSISHAAVQISAASAGSPPPLPPVDAEVLDETDGPVAVEPLLLEVSDVSDPQAKGSVNATMHTRVKVLFSETENDCIRLHPSVFVGSVVRVVPMKILWGTNRK